MLSYLKALFQRQKADSDLNEEFGFHLEKHVELNIARGMTPDEARRQALISFGGVEQARERVRETSRLRWLANVWQDARYAARIFAKSPGFTAVAVLTLALGIGLNTAIYSVIEAILYRALPANHPEELVLVRWYSHHRPRLLFSHSSYGDCPNHRQGENQDGCSFSLPFLNLVGEKNVSFSGLAAMAGGPRIDLSGNGAASIIDRTELVSGGYFPTLGARAILGRTLEPADDRPNAAPVVLLSYGYWQTAFGSSREVVGRTVRLNAFPFTIVGVAEPRFTGLTPGQRVDLWLPLHSRQRLDIGWAPDEDNANSWWLVVVGRLKPGVTAKQAQSELSLLYADETMHEQKALFQPGDNPGITLVAAQDGLVGHNQEMLGTLYLLMMAVGLVLMIACANITGLLLARAARRSREMAVRLALGARRTRLVSQFLVESLLLSSTGGILALLIGHWGARTLLVMAEKGMGTEFLFIPRLDLRVLGFTAAVAVLTGAIAGVVPALRSLKVDLTPALKTVSGVSDARRTRWYGVRNVLVVAQVSLAIVALVVAGLLVRTLRNLRASELGFDPHNMLVFGLNPRLAGYKGAQIPGVYRDLQEQIAALPGVTDVTYSLTPLLSGSESDTDFHAPGTPDKEGSNAFYMTVGPRFFESMHIPLSAGRDFSGADYLAAAAREARPPDAKPDPTRPPITIIVNQAFVRRFLPHTNPLGQHIDDVIPEDPTWPRGSGYEIVGVCGDARYDTLRGDIGPTMYVASGGSPWFSLRTAGDPMAIVPTIRDLINRKDSNLAMFRIRTENDEIDQQVFIEGLVARLSSFFGLVALFLSCAGIYGLLSYEVARRTREIGIRMAVGARQSDVVGMVVRHGLLVAIAGALIGAGASFGVKKLMETLLYGVRPGDPLTLAAVTAILIVVVLAACYLPARRASKVDPLVALRDE
jgi:predicted permease